MISGVCASAYYSPQNDETNDIPVGWLALPREDCWQLIVGAELFRNATPHFASDSNPKWLGR
jgi:hypothetical protein